MTDDHDRRIQYFQTAVECGLGPDCAKDIAAWVDEAGADTDLRYRCVQTATDLRTGAMSIGSFLGLAGRIETFAKAKDKAPAQAVAKKGKTPARKTRKTF